MTVRNWTKILGSELDEGNNTLMCSCGCTEMCSVVRDLLSPFCRGVKVKQRKGLSWQARSREPCETGCFEVFARGPLGQLTCLKYMYYNCIKNCTTFTACS